VVQVPPHTVVLVEGESDRVALEALARRHGRDLAEKGITIVPMGGVTNARSNLERYGPHGAGRRVAGLYDAKEEDDVRRGLARAGLGPNLTRADMETLGFFRCVADLEDELIRALGPAAVERVIVAEGEIRSFRTLQKQAAQRERGVDAQLRRFIGSKGGRKIRYAQLLVDALDLSRVPRPLEGLLAALEVRV
jgi:hypothetical protein